jgi:Raf kinase inhibitor-like YbhB/YbcL family protein
MTRLTSLTPWLAAIAVALCVQLPAQAAQAAQERFTLNIPGVSDDRLFTSAAASDASGCGGHNVSPALSWNAGPAGTLSYAIVMHDPDGQKGQGVDHWVHYGIKATTRQIASGVGAKSTLEGVSGINSKGTAGYVGPCPPAGDSAHHYICLLYTSDAADE